MHVAQISQSGSTMRRTDRRKSGSASPRRRPQQDEVATQLKLPAPADEGPEKTEARRWELETRYEALSAEIKMLDQELLSQPARVDLLRPSVTRRSRASSGWASG